MPTSVTTEPKPPRPHRGDLQRVTVNLTPRSGHALEMAVKRTGDSQTDTINRAIQVYAYLTDITETGGRRYVPADNNDHMARRRPTQTPPCAWAPPGRTRRPNRHRPHAAARTSPVC